MKPPECLHCSDLWQFSAQYGDWLAIKLFLYSHALVVDPDATTGAPHRRNSLKVWMDLCLVTDIVRVHKGATARRNSDSQSKRIIGKYPFTVETYKVKLQFATASVEERDEWLHCLLLATKLHASQTDSQNDAAFFRFASSGSEDSEEESRQSSLTSWSDATAAQTDSTTSSVTSTIVVITAKDDHDHSVSTIISLNETIQGRLSLYRLKLDAIRHMKAELRRLNYSKKKSVTSELLHMLERPPDSFMFYLERDGEWLQNDQQYIDHYLIDHSSTIKLELVPVYRIPKPALTLNIVETRNKVSDLSQRPYTCYVIDVVFNGTTWQLSRRYKDFNALQTELKCKYPNHTLPMLPPKHMFTPVKGEFIQYRKQELEKFLKQLLEYPDVSTDVVLFSFLGIVSTARDPETSRNTKSVLHVTSLHESVAIGDIVLFSCRFGASRLQRKFTGAKYDHVGIVVPGESQNLLRIMEATSEGIQVYSLKVRLMAYAREVSNVIVVRKIETERSIELMDTLTDFVRRVNGNRYSLAEILRFTGKSDRNLARSTLVTHSKYEVGDDSISSNINSSTPSSPVTSSSDSTKSQRKYFCSSLVAAAWKELGWLQTKRKSSSFWPGSFEDGGEVERLLRPELVLGPEIVIDCRIVEVGLSASI
ncbi:putative Phox domain, PX domain superfamily, papain-like cysteine peptidase superfamily [Plasmopara halstedii]